MKKIRERHGHLTHFNLNKWVSIRRYFQRASVFKLSDPELIFSILLLLRVFSWTFAALDVKVHWMGVLGVSAFSFNRCWGSSAWSRKVWISLYVYIYIYARCQYPLMLTEKDWVFIPRAHCHTSQWWRSLLSTWFTPICPRRRRRRCSSLTPSPLPLVKHVRRDTTNDLTMCWLEIGDCLRRCCVYFSDRL